MNTTTVSIELANVAFRHHGIDARGKTTMRKQLERSQVVEFFTQLTPCLIGMELCGGAHCWACKLSEFGHTVNLIAPQYAKRYVTANKSDAIDAEATFERVGRPSRRLVPIRSTEQQALLGPAPRPRPASLSEKPSFGSRKAGQRRVSISSVETFGRGVTILRFTNHDYILHYSRSDQQIVIVMKASPIAASRLSSIACNSPTGTQPYGHGRGVCGCQGFA